MNPKERRRARRADVVKRIRGVYLQCPDLGQPEFKVINISEFGLGLATSDVIPPPEVGATYTAVLRVGYTSIKVRIKVMRRTREVIGMEFMEPNDMLQGAIRTFFQPELLGAALRPAKGSTSNSTELVDDDGNRIVANFKKGEKGDTPTSLSIEVLGNEFLWSDGKRLEWVQNGRTLPLDEYMRKQLIRYVANVSAMSPGKQSLLEAVLRTAESVPGGDRDVTAPILQGSKD